MYNAGCNKTASRSHYEASQQQNNDSCSAQQPDQARKHYLDVWYQTMAKTLLYSEIVRYVSSSVSADTNAIAMRLFVTYECSTSLFRWVHRHKLKLHMKEAHRSLKWMVMMLIAMNMQIEALCIACRMRPWYN